MRSAAIPHRILDPGCHIGMHQINFAQAQILKHVVIHNFTPNLRRNYSAIYPSLQDVLFGKTQIIRYLTFTIPA